MGESKVRSGGQKPRSTNQPKAKRQSEKPQRRKLVWLGTLGTAGIAVLVGILVNVLSTQVQRVVPPPPSAPASSAQVSGTPQLEVDGVSFTPASTLANGDIGPFKLDVKLLNTGNGVAAINDARLIIQKFVILPQCASNGDFTSTGSYGSKMPINPKVGQVDIPISQLVPANGADRFDLLLQVPLVKGPVGPNIYLYRVHLYLTYNVHTKPLDVGEVLVDLPIAPSEGDYYWGGYIAAHPENLSENMPRSAIPEYKRCAINNSYALRSILTLPAMRPAELAAILPQLRYT